MKYKLKMGTGTIFFASENKWSLSLLFLLLMAGCSIQKDAEFDKITNQYRPKDAKPPLPVLNPDAPEADFLTYALLNNPRVEAAFYDWKANAENVTVAGYQQFPDLTLSAQIQRSVTSFIPGLMSAVIYPDKLATRAEAYSAEAKKKRYIFEEEILRTIFNVKKTLYDAALLADKIRFSKEILILQEGLETLAQKNLSVNLKDVQSKDLIMIQMDKEHLKNRIADLQDQQKSLMARWRAALGVEAGENDPPLPLKPFPENTLPPDKDLLQTALVRNLQLKQFEKEIEQAEKLVKLAYYENVPDLGGFTSLGVDTKRTPVQWMPELDITLPIWRKKIDAQVASALAGEKRTRAMLTDAQINLVAELAEKSFMWRQSNRWVNVLKNHHIPDTEAKVDTINASIFAGKGDVSDLLNARRELLELKITLTEALAERQTIYTEVSTIVLSHWPEEITNIFK